MTNPAPVRLNPFYPIAPDVTWLKRIVPLGVKTVQLRLKDASEVEARRQIAESLAVTRVHGCQLIVNDYWQLAIELGANFIHLGQEDLAAADIKAIKAAKLRLGVSSHDTAELETAIAAAPDYVALGPVYETKLKIMKWAPQGLDRVTAWKKRLGAIPLVAIGGITPERAPGVIAAGADSIAVITDFLTHPAPEARIRTWVAWGNAQD
jgi:thiamine-phosphate pyrophosphorylase